MKKEMRDKWVKALRSGEYKQGMGYLRRDSGDGEQYCCLGVLAKECLDGEWLKRGDLHSKGFYQLDDEMTNRLSDEMWIYHDNLSGVYLLGRLPERVRNILERENTYWIEQLIDMNDRGWNFEEIADWIEGNL
jgi:hypothetical protein